MELLKEILEGILVVILGIALAACLIIALYLLWFEAIPTFWKEITKKKDNE
jgi:hypothetical protein